MGSVTKGFRYSFGIHMGVVRGPVDELVEIRVGDKTAWTGSITANESIKIDKYDLFGGEDGEGGVQGDVIVMMGADDQVAPATLTGMLGVSAVPGFRRAMTIFYNGIVSMMNPYPKSWKFRIRRSTKGWDGPVFQPGFATIGLDGSASANSPYGKALRFASNLVYTQIDYGGEINGSYGEIVAYGSGAYLYYPNILLTGLGAAYTVEGMFRFASKPDDNSPNKWMSRACLFSCFAEQPAGMFQGWSIDVNWALNRWVICWNSETLESEIMDLPLKLNTWVHIAATVQQIGSRLYVKIFQNGNLAWAVDTPAPDYVQGRNNPIYGLRVGMRQDNKLAFNGWIDNFRVTGGSRYTVPFVPPTGDLPSSPDLDPLFNNVYLLLQSSVDDPGSTTVTDQSANGYVPAAKQNVIVDNNVPFSNVDSLAWAETTTEIRAMNPAHMIYECLTNREWGRGMPRSRIDEDSFLAAAQRLFIEGFGMCIRWQRTEEVGTFITHIIDTICAALYADRTTGKMVLKLIRDDYVYNDLHLYDEESGVLEISEATVASPTDCINEVIVTYRDPVTDSLKKVRAQNLATLIMTGGEFNSVSRDYSGVPTETLAMRLAKRDLRSGSIALRRFSLTLDRRGWSIYPGHVIRFRSISRNIPEMAVRVVTFDEGSLQDGKIKISVIQDVFSMPSAALTAPQGEGWTPPNTQPCIGRHEVFEMPYAIAAKYLSAADFAAVTPEAARLAVVCETGQALNTTYTLAIKNGASDSSEVPVDSSSYCGYTP